MKIMSIMFYFLSFVACEFYYIRQYKTNKFVSGGTANLVAPTLVTFDNAGAFEVRKSKDDFRLMEIKLLDDMSDLAWDMASGGSKLIFYNYHGMFNQVFRLIPINCSGIFAISYSNKCLAYNKSYADFELETCNEDDSTQHFEFLDVEKFVNQKNSSGDDLANPDGSGSEGSGDTGFNGNGSGCISPVMASMHEMLKDLHSVIYGSASILGSQDMYLFGKGVGHIKGQPLNPTRLALAQGNVKTILTELNTICHLL